MRSWTRSLILALAFAILLPSTSAWASDQTEPVKVWVRFKDKGPSTARIFHASRAFEDLAVYAPYIAALQARGFSTDTRLKWQNQVSGRINAGLLSDLAQLPFVAEVSRMPRKARPEPGLSRLPLPWGPHGLGKISALGLDYGAGRALMESLHVDKVHAWITGSGMQPGRSLRIAVIDADFYLGSQIFQPLFAQNRIKDQWDFVSNQPLAVKKELIPGSHGAECLSLIGGNLPGTLVGVAPEAEFLLYRAEENDHEGFVEEDYVAAAIERAVDSGAQVISISLGYRYEYDDGNADLPYAAMDGKTRPSSIAATGAARRNVIVSVAMGNLPSTDHIPATPSLTAPADADSILSVGIGDRFRRRCSYSCTGPAADGRLKPEVSSMGLIGNCAIAVANTDQDSGMVEQFQGTSFAAPVVAGIAALLRQTHPELNAEAIRQALIKTADRASHPDSGLGNGIVDAWAAFLHIHGDTAEHASPIGWVRLYHRGGLNPLFLPRNSLDPLPNLQLLDINGRRIPVSTRIFGPTVLVQPRHDLRTGVYLVHIR